MTQQHSSDIVAVVPAAGVGTRMAATLPKQYLTIAGATVLEHSLQAIAADPRVKAVVVVLANEDHYFQALDIALPVPLYTVNGGQERSQSVIAGLRKAQQLEAKWVLVHDAARPCLRKSDLHNLVSLGCTEQGALLAVPVRDTMKRACPNNTVQGTVDRSALWHALTPQLFATDRLLSAMTAALQAGVTLTDEASAMEWAGYQPQLVTGHADNLKVTLPEDIALAEYYLNRGDLL